MLYLGSKKYIPQSPNTPEINESHAYTFFKAKIKNKQTNTTLDSVFLWDRHLHRSMVSPAQLRGGQIAVKV